MTLPTTPKTAAATKPLAKDVSGDVFAYLARFLPKSMDVLWVVQELEGVRRLTTLEQRELAYRELYLKIESRIVSAGRDGLTIKTLRDNMRTHFTQEVHRGFLAPLFSAALSPAAPGTQKASAAPKSAAASVWKFENLKKSFDTAAAEPTLAQLKTGRGDIIPVALRGTAWRRDLAGNRRGFVVSIKDLSAVRQYMQARLQALTAALRQVMVGDFSAFLSFEAKSGDLKEYVQAVKELIYDREAKLQEIDRLRYASREHDELLQAKQADVEQVTQKLTEVRDRLQQRIADLESARQTAVSRELKLQARVAELEQAKREIVAHELRQQQRIAELEVAKQAAVERELKLQEHVAELEAAKQAAVERELQVERLKRKFEQFSKGLSSEW